MNEASFREYRCARGYTHLFKIFLFFLLTFNLGGLLAFFVVVVEGVVTINTVHIHFFFFFLSQSLRPPMKGEGVCTFQLLFFNHHYSSSLKAEAFLKNGKKKWILCKNDGQRLGLPPNI